MVEVVQPGRLLQAGHLLDVEEARERVKEALEAARLAESWPRRCCRCVRVVCIFACWFVVAVFCRLLWQLWQKLEEEKMSKENSTSGAG